MRENKYRAWDGKRMWNVTEIDWRTPKQGRDIFYVRGIMDNGSLIGGHADYIDIKRIKLMQYTGLKDKNGKEIYEGDILTGFRDGTLDYSHIKVEVYYDEGAFREKYFGEPLSEYVHCACGYGNVLEVIGNIYENKELLE